MPALNNRDLKELAKGLARYAPAVWRAICSKRYLLPTYRQCDYYSQEMLDTVLGFFLATYVGANYQPQPDHILRAMYTVSVMALQEGRPIYFLERELGEALLRTALPLDLSTDDIHWRRRCMRIMLPKELIALQRLSKDKTERSLMYLDIGQAQAKERHELPLTWQQELRLFAAKSGILKGSGLVVPFFERGGMVVASQLIGDGDIGMNYATIRPFEGLKLKDIKVGGHFQTGSICDETDDQLIVRMEHLALNILLFMGSVPLEYEPTVQEQTPIRKLEVVNDRVVPGLFPAKFVGRSQYRPSTRPAHAHEARFTGQHLIHHWRAGHWKRQVFGPGRADRKLIWIEPYEAGKLVDQAT